MPNEPGVPAGPLSLRIYPQDDAMVVECTGRVISGGTGELRHEVKALFPYTKRVILDLTNVIQLDSMGLGAIVGLYASAKAAGCELELINLSQRVREIFRVTNLLSVFEVYGEHIVKIRKSKRCILYIVKRTQLYLDDDLWNALHVRARQARTTVSELVRQAARERYLGPVDARARAMQAVVGIWKSRKDIAGIEAYVRGLRRGARLKRLSGA